MVKTLNLSYDDSKHKEMLQLKEHLREEKKLKHFSWEDYFYTLHQEKREQYEEE